MYIATYDPSKIILDVAGYKVENIETIRVEKQKPTFRLVKGIRGSYTRINTKDEGFDIRLTLKHTSKAISVFSEIALYDQLYNTGKLIVSLSDIGGETRLICEDAFLEGLPSFSFEAEQTDREWTIVCPRVSEIYIEGNQKINISGTDILSAALFAIAT